MSNECLVTSLRGEVGNKDIITFDAVRLLHSEQSSFDGSVYFQVYQSADSTCKAIDTNFVNSSGVNIGTSVEISPLSGRTTVYGAIGLGRFDVNGKQTLRELIAENYYWSIVAESLNCAPLLETLRGIITGDIKHIGGLTTLSSLEIIGGRDAYGDISSLKTLVALTDLRFGSFQSVRNIKGDIGYLGTLVNLTRLDINQTGISGALESFVENLYNNGRTSGSITIYGASTSPYVTFNGNSITGNQLTITFNANGAVVSSGGSTIGTLYNGAWTY